MEKGFGCLNEMKKYTLLGSNLFHYRLRYARKREGRLQFFKNLEISVDCQDGKIILHV